MINKQKASEECLTLSQKNHYPFESKSSSKNAPNIFSSRAQQLDNKNSDQLRQDTYNYIKKRVQTLKPNYQGYKEYLWIIDKGRELFQTKSAWKQNLGPGKYPSLSPTEHHHSNWSKSKRFNYQQTEIPTLVGPGLYETQQKDNITKKNVASSAFKSKTTKSYLADKINELIKLQQVTINPESQFEPLDSKAYFQNECHYQRVRVKKRTNGSPVFMSKCERLPSIQGSNVGPGSYLRQQTRKSSHVVIKRIATQPRSHISKQQIITKHESHKEITPGPGSYNRNSDNQRKKGKGVLGVIMKDQRFKKTITKCPGPTDYQLIKSIAKTEKNTSHPIENEKVRRIDQMKGAAVRKALTKNRQYTQSQMSIYKMFRDFTKEKHMLENDEQQSSKHLKS